jgi:hypothetical protein
MVYLSVLFCCTNLGWLAAVCTADPELFACFEVRDLLRGARDSSGAW